MRDPFIVRAGIVVFIEKDFRPYVEQLEEQSVVGEVWVKAPDGPSTSGGQEVFEGPHGRDTAAPVLFASNTFDQTTPIEKCLQALRLRGSFGWLGVCSLFANAPKFKYARRLTIGGMGHGGSATMKQGAFGVLKMYFQGTMCGREIYCPLEVGPFNVLLTGSIQENLEAAGLANIRSLCWG